MKCPRNSPPFRSLRLNVQGEVKDRPLFNLALGPHLAAVVLDDALGDRQSDAVAGELFHSVDALEGAKQLVDVPHVKSGPVVTNEVGLFAILFSNAELYPGIFVLTRELPGIFQEIL